MAVSYLVNIILVMSRYNLKMTSTGGMLCPALWSVMRLFVQSMCLLLTSHWSVQNTSICVLVFIVHLKFLNILCLKT